MISMFSSKQFMRIFKLIWKFLSWSNTKFLSLIYTELCSNKRTELTIRSWELKDSGTGLVIRWFQVQAFHPATNISPFSWRLIDLVQWKHVGCKYWNKGTFCRNHQLDSDRRPWRTAQLPESFSTAEMLATITQCLTLVLLNVRSKMEVHILSRWSISSWINKVTMDLCPETI